MKFTEQFPSIGFQSTIFVEFCHHGLCGDGVSVVFVVMGLYSSGTIA
jgi:hypothetical protein